ncbi:CIC11C00000003037 [Sungouiella intermedia]|uniref:CIC11C00000000711 n=1 Tax=Sungouiella intermedia TaxID=45354 RepID=A0A1L0G1Z8_9ASCO|nr:CIC11C00000003037 [[Candida] intermedia]SGZ51372.1 CIC11C00000000711 [[Candida] intermedia]
MTEPYVISISSDEEPDDDVEVLEFRKLTQQLIAKAPPKVVKKLAQAECPICFDEITNATATLCGHVYCLECLQRSLSASSARGQTRGRKGVGLCPMCRKTVAFKDAVVLRLKTGLQVCPPLLDEEKGENPEGNESNGIGPHSHEKTDATDSDDELITGLF